MTQLLPSSPASGPRGKLRRLCNASNCFCSISVPRGAGANTPAADASPPTVISQSWSRRSNPARRARRVRPCSRPLLVIASGAAARAELRASRMAGPLTCVAKEEKEQSQAAGLTYRTWYK
jgi:hypothetical protein